MRIAIIPSILFVFCGLAVLGALAAGICVLVIMLNRRYLNRRLKGEGKIRSSSVQPLTVILITVLAISVVANIVLGGKAISLGNQLENERNKTIETTYPRTSLKIEGLEKNPQYSLFAAQMVSGTLTGYKITQKVDGDFECFIARISEEYKNLENLHLMPKYFVYIRYTGEVFEDFQMERRYRYGLEGNGHGSTGSFKSELLIIGNDVDDDMIWGIGTTIKRAPQTTETKENWDNIPTYAESYFMISLGWIENLPQD